LISAKLGRGGKSEQRGYEEILSLVSKMVESNVWGGNIKGYFFKGTIETGMRSAILSFARSNGWQQTTGKRIIKYGTIIRGGRLGWLGMGKKHLLIFGYYRGTPNRVYCSLTIL
jgi:hypothetical protein